jgi:hypothetical protein
VTRAQMLHMENALTIEDERESSRAHRQSDMRALSGQTDWGIAEFVHSDRSTPC